MDLTEQALAVSRGLYRLNAAARALADGGHYVQVDEPARVAKLILAS